MHGNFTMLQHFMCMCYCRTRSEARNAPSGTSPERQIIVEPFSFSTVLERNLSASWYREIPTIKIDAKFNDLKVVNMLHDVFA